MTPKDALKNIKQHMKTYHRHPVDEELNEEIEIIEQYLNELEELKRDAARYFSLLDKYNFNTLTPEEMHERWALEEKISKGR